MSQDHFISHLTSEEVQCQLKNIGRYRRSLSLGKIAVGALVLIMIIGVGIAPFLQSDEEGIRIALSGGESQSRAEKPVMKNPRFESVDKRNQPYTVKAKEAVQEDDETVLLSDITADVSLRNDLWVALKAGAGRLNIKAQHLQLFDKVNVFANNGYEFRCQTLQVQMQNSQASTDNGVTAQGPIGTITAQSFQLDGKNQRLRFTHNVKLVIYP